MRRAAVRVRDWLHYGRNLDAVVFGAFGSYLAGWYLAERFAPFFVASHTARMDRLLQVEDEEMVQREWAAAGGEGPLAVMPVVDSRPLLPRQVGGRVFLFPSRHSERQRRRGQQELKQMGLSQSDAVRNSLWDAQVRIPLTDEQVRVLTKMRVLDMREELSLQSQLVTAGVFAAVSASFMVLRFSVLFWVPVAALFTIEAATQRRAFARCVRQLEPAEREELLTVLELEHCHSGNDFSRIDVPFIGTMLRITKKIVFSAD